MNLKTQAILNITVEGFLEDIGLMSPNQLAFVIGTKDGLQLIDFDFEKQTYVQNPECLLSDLVINEFFVASGYKCLATREDTSINLHMSSSAIRIRKIEDGKLSSVVKTICTLYNFQIFEPFSCGHCLIYPTKGNNNENQISIFDFEKFQISKIPLPFSGMQAICSLRLLPNFELALLLSKNEGHYLMRISPACMRLFIEEMARMDVARMDEAKKELQRLNPGFNNSLVNIVGEMLSDYHHIGLFPFFRIF